MPLPQEVEPPFSGGGANWEARLHDSRSERERKLIAARTSARGVEGDYALDDEGAPITRVRQNGALWARKGTHLDMRMSTDEQKNRFLAAVAEKGTLTAGLDAVNASLHSERALRKSSPEWAEAIEEALRRYTDSLHDEVHRRAVEGYDRPVVSQGKVVCTERVYSDSLLLALMRAHDPERWGKTVNVKSENTSTTTHVHTVSVDLKKLTREQREALRVLIGAQPGAAAHALVTGHAKAPEEPDGRHGVIDAEATEVTGVVDRIEGSLEIPE